MAKAPVLPIAIKGTSIALPRGKIVPKFKKIVTFKIGELMYFDKYYGKPMTKKLLREITTKVMKEIARLGNQKYNFD